MTTATSAEPLGTFHPLIAEWFAEEVGQPTDVQARAWPAIARGENVLVTAPTGSGKTLTAFLWSLHQLLSGGWEAGKLRVLYVSPLKALNNDIERNLLAPLAALEARFEAAGALAAPVRVQTRSGDTPAGEKQRMLRRPPEILITTPETLNILLTSKGGRRILGGIRCVILDEIHAVAGSKRGTHLITAVDRLIPIAGEFQRVALSATIRPPERIARFVGGYRLVGSGETVGYRERDVRVIRSEAVKSYDVRVCATGDGQIPDSLSRAPDRTERASARPRAVPPSASPWDALVADFKQRIAANRSTLFFANSRRTTEKVTRLLNEDEPAELAYSHHGSLSRELRSVVEKRLKEGRLSAIVSTNSLELGIDIGALDEVVLIQSPPTMASAVQRIGRAGHGVGETSRGRLYPLFGRDLIEAAVVASGVVEQAIEEVTPVTGALDVLAQVVLSMVAAERWDIDELYDSLRTSYPYRELKRRQFELVLEMLAGRYADSRVRELYPRVSLDRIDNTVQARRGAARLVYLSGGTIPDRGYFHLRHQDSMAKIGELDEEFVWERSLGDSFSMGAQSWRIVRITHNDVMVGPAHGGAAMAPFWRADARSRDFFFSERVALFLQRAEAFFEAGDSAALLGVFRDEHRMEETAATQLLDLLARQRASTESALPHRRHLLIEYLADEEAADGHERVIFHTLWGGRVNRPLAMALEVAWRRRFGVPLAIESENDCLMVELPRDFDAPELLTLVRADNVEALLREKLETTGFFGARFRENAGRALLLPRSGYRHRVPLWLNRQRAKKLLESVSRYEDFPILFETWRTCLRDEFDLESMRTVLEELAREEIQVTEARTTMPSPLAANLIWKQTNRLMYEDDVPEGGTSALRSDLLKELVFSSSLRPELPAELRDRFQRKLHRTYSGYSPADAVELLEWVRERVVLVDGEWRDLLSAIERDRPDLAVSDLLSALDGKIVRLVSRDGSVGDRVVAVEELPRLFAAEAIDPSSVEMRTVHDGGPAGDLAELPHSTPTDPDRDPLAEVIAEWLRAYGPIPRESVVAAFPISNERFDEVASRMVEEERWVVDRFGDDTSVVEVCDAENLERLLRLLRSEARPTFEALPIDQLPLHLATQHRLGATGGGLSDLQRALESLFALPMPAGLWESEALPARLDPYYPSWLDSLLQESDLLWTGAGMEKLTFLLAGDLELIDRNDGEGGSETVLPPRDGRFELSELAESSGLDTGALTERLWGEVWGGGLTNTGYAAVRSGVLNRFRPAEATVESRPASARSGRRSFERWRSSRPYAGEWTRVHSLDSAPEPLDALDVEELNKDRARLLLDRYGVLFRELLQRELPEFQWRSVFRSLRIMELSGEVLSGQFFQGIHGLQFASPAAYRRLREGLPADRIYWLNAVDPASPCGLGLEGWKGRLPRRIPSSHLVFHGSRLVVVSTRNGGELQIDVEPDHPHLLDYVGFLKTLLTRQFNPLKVVEVETINGEPAPTSPYSQPVASLFVSTRDHRTLKLRREY